MEKGSGQFLLLDDALRVKGRDAQNAYANIQGMGNQKSVLDNYFEKLQRNFFCNCFTISQNKIS